MKFIDDNYNVAMQTVGLNNLYDRCIYIALRILLTKLGGRPTSKTMDDTEQNTIISNVYMDRI